MQRREATTTPQQLRTRHQPPPPPPAPARGLNSSEISGRFAAPAYRSRLRSQAAGGRRNSRRRPLRSTNHLSLQPTGGSRAGPLRPPQPAAQPVMPDQAVFSFLYLKKIKISKIYVGFGKFQKYTPVALWGATGLKCIFFSSNLQRSPWRKKRGGPVASWGGRQGPPPILNPGHHSPTFPLSFEPKNSEKKRG